jgi:hypoxanthine phosphoribosyltransferase
MTPTETAATSRVRVLYSAEQIREKVRELGLAIARDYAGVRPLLVGVLKGACAFHADLARAIPAEVELDFLSVSSYGTGTTSSGSVKLLADLRAEIAGRHVLLCEAVVDSGRSVAMLRDLLRPRGPASLKVAALLDKRPCREVEVPLDYIGWTVGAEFVVGYGLDAAERYRNLPYVGVIEEA